MSRSPFVSVIALCLVAGSAWAKPWQGLTPGVSTRSEAVSKFGEPTRTITEGAFEIALYAGLTAISGTIQAQLKYDPTTTIIARIDVYPAITLTIADVEAAYGGSCAEIKAGDCYVRKLTRDNRTSFSYRELGLVVFFKADGTVQSLSFLPERS